jgi:hypothetical protein
MNRAFLPQEHVGILNHWRWTGTIVLIRAWHIEGLELTLTSSSWGLLRRGMVGNALDT